MVPMTIDKQRELVDLMQRTLNGCLKSKENGMFSMAATYHECGSPMCIIGHGESAYGISIPSLGLWILDLLGLWRGKIDRFGKGWHMLFSCGIPDDVALHRWTALLNHHRRRLATMEVEAGEWGPLRAKDAPVGQAREAAVQEKLAVLV